MWQPFEPREVRRVFTTESRQKDRDLFNRTHHPIRRILVSHNRLELPSGEFIGEHDLLGIVRRSAPLDDNRVWFVVGETGSGKSELCQWLEYQLGGTHLPVHVARSSASLAGMLAALTRHLPAARAFGPSDLPEEVLSEHLRAHLRLLAHRSGRAEWIAYTRALDASFAGLARSLYGQHIPDEAALLAKLPPAPPGLRLGEWLASAAREALGLQSLGQTLRALVEYLATRDQRPVLLLEDITTLGFLRDDLLDYIFDLSAPGFDAVVGLTTGFEHSHLGAGLDLSEFAYVRDRLSGRFVLSQGSGETFFLSSPDDLVELVRRYMGCLSAPRLPAALTAPFEGLYPFTPGMIERIYVHLTESGNPRQTPRNLLDAVIKPALLQAAPPHESLMLPHAYLRAPSVTFRQEDLTPQAVALLYWHGVIRDGRVTVDPAVAQAFGFHEPPAAEAYALPTRSAHLFGAGADVDDRQREWRETLRELQAWHGGTGGFPKRHHLKHGFTRFALAALEPRRLQLAWVNALEADPVEYTRGGEHLPIFLPDSGDSAPGGDWPSITLTRQWPKQLLEEFVNYAFAAHGQIECFADPAFTLEVTEQAVSTFQAQVRSYLNELLGMPLESFVYGAWWLVRHVTGAKLPEELTPAAELLSYDQPRLSHSVAWSAPRPHGVLHRTHRELRDAVDTYRALFVSVFHYRDDVVNTGLVEQHAARFDPDVWLEAVSRLDLRRVTRAPFRQARSRVPLGELVRPVVEYARALVQYDRAAEDLLAWQECSATLGELVRRAEQLPALLDQLERCTGRAGWLLESPVPPGNWDHAAWRELHEQCVTCLQRLERTAWRHARKTVVRAWLERLEAHEALRWAAELDRYTRRLEQLLRTHYPPGTDSAARREQLRGRLEQLLGGGAACRVS